MFDALKSFLDDLTPAPSDRFTPGAPTARLAAAVLLMEVMRADGGISAAERAVAAHALREELRLPDPDMDALLRAAELESVAAYDYFRFTNVLDEQLDHPRKIALVEAMWRVAYADLHLGARENAVIARSRTSCTCPMANTSPPSSAPGRRAESALDPAPGKIPG